MDRPHRPAMRPEARGFAAITRQTSLTTTVVAALTLLAVAEILLYRVGAAAVAYLAPSSPGPARLLEAAGSAAAGGTAILVFAGALALGTRRSGYPTGRALLLVGASATLVTSLAPGAGGMPLVHSTIIVAAIALTLTPGPSGAMRWAVVSASVGVVLGQVRFLAPGVGDWALARIGAEAGLIGAVVLVGVAWSRGRVVARGVQVAGSVTAVAVLAVILVRPAAVSMLTIWVLGATLSLPLTAYAAAAWGSTVIAWGARADPGLRSAAAGIILLWTAGTAPTAIHHNLTALIGLFLLTIPRAYPSPRRTPPTRREHHGEADS